MRDSGLMRMGISSLILGSEENALKFLDTYYEELAVERRQAFFNGYEGLFRDLK